MNKKILIAVGAVAVLLMTTASSCGTKADANFSCKDAAADGSSVCGPGSNMKVFIMPEGFRNVAFACNGKTGMYVTSRGWVKNGSGDLPSLPSSISTVANDPNCP